jgi:hypothetical protein
VPKVRTARRPPPFVDDYDIALPALSQIRMSQVEVLPSPLRKQVVSKMEAERARNSGSPLLARGVIELARDARFRQTDVKRMFRLAAVKAGAQALPSAFGSAVSLTQLASFPLELQLQVANDDSRRLGVLSPEKKSRKTVSSSRHMPDWKTEKAQSKRRGSPVTVRIAPQKKASDDVAEDPHTASCNAATDARHFFRDNVRPLGIFMDENPEADKEATSQVVEFLCLCVIENRLADAGVLLRSIKNRNDRWTSIAFDSIFDAVDRKVQECFQANLDRDWVLQL